MTIEERSGKKGTTFRYKTRFVGASWPPLSGSCKTRELAHERLQLLERLHRYERADVWTKLHAGAWDVRDVTRVITTDALAQSLTISEIESRIHRTSATVKASVVATTEPSMKKIAQEWIKALAEGHEHGKRTKRRMADTTIIWYQRAIVTLIARLDDPPMLSTVTPAILKRMRTAITETAKARTWNNYVIALQSFWRWCSEHATYHAYVPEIRWAAIRENEPRVDPDDDTLDLTPAKYRQIIDAVGAVKQVSRDPTSWDDWRDFFTVLAHTGLRVDELQSARRQDLIAKGLRITEWEHGDTYHRLKTLSSARTVALTPTARRILSEWSRATKFRDELVTTQGIDYLLPDHLRVYETARYRFATLVRAAGLIVPGSKREPSKAHPRRRQRDGKPLFSIHDLRHTFAIGLKDQGVPIITIGRYLGHSDQGSAQVAARYSRSRPSDEETRTHVERLEQGLGKVSNGRSPSQNRPKKVRVTTKRLVPRGKTR